MSKLFSPVKIGDLELKNRFMMAPMENGLAEFGGEVSQKLIDFFVERAKNEVSIIITGSVAVTPEGRGLPTQLTVYDDKFVPGLKRLTDAVHNAGGKIGAQVYHAGRQATAAVTGIQPVAPSAIPCQILGNDPRAMTIDDIDDMVVKFREGTERCIAAGFDLIEVHFAHGYLLHSFLSPHTNKRLDEYGGSLQNRMKFPVRVLKEILDVCEDKVPVTIRISADEYVEDGLKFDEVKIICKEVEKMGVNAISLTAGCYDAVEYTIQPMFVEQGFLVPFSREMKKEIEIPVIVAGRLNSANLIEEIIEKDDADMVAIGRGLIADEELVIKLRDKRYNDVRYCVACNQGCIDKVFIGQGVACLVNPRGGHEERKIERTEEIKKVVVIGAGPAGLESARVAVLRGHDVTVVDKNDKVGGKLEILSAPPEKDTFLFFRDYLYNQFVKLGIKFTQKEIKSADDLEEFDADAVIVATGSIQSKPPISGIDNNIVLLAEDVLRGDCETGKKVAVLGGGLVGTETAKFLANQGKDVYIVEMLDAIAKEIGATYQGHLFDYLNDKQVEQMVNAKVIEITAEGLILEDGKLVNVDNVVIASGYKSNNDIVDSLKSNFDSVYVIGDAKQPRRITDATEEGFLAACAI